MNDQDQRDLSEFRRLNKISALNGYVGGVSAELAAYRADADRRWRMIGVLEDQRNALLEAIGAKNLLDGLRWIKKHREAKS